MERKKVGRMEVERSEERTAERNDILIPGLPTELAILCMARVPRSNHEDIRGVCRSWRNLLHGTLLSKVRVEQSLAEEWLYLWTFTQDTWHCFDPSLEEWWRLPKMPHDNRVPGHSGFAAFDGKIFVIGGCLENFYSTDDRLIPCRTVSFFDVRSYCWKRAADLNIARSDCLVGVIDNQLYVFGGHIEGAVEDEGAQGSTITVEVYDPIMDVWSFVSSMKILGPLRDSVVLGGNFYIVGDCGGAVYDAKMDKWADMAPGLNRHWWHKTTVLNGKLFTIVPDTSENSIVDEVIHIHVYNPNTDAWERVGTWDTRDEGDKFCMIYELELATIDGMLCMPYVWTGLPGSGQERCSSIFMGIFEVNESTEGLSGSTTFRCEDEIAYEYAESQPQHIKRCHVITL